MFQACDYASHSFFLCPPKFWRYIPGLGYQGLLEYVSKASISICNNYTATKHYQRRAMSFAETASGSNPAAKCEVRLFPSDGSGGQRWQKTSLAF
jgi:hypothetical protein